MHQSPYLVIAVVASMKDHAVSDNVFEHGAKIQAKGGVNKHILWGPYREGVRRFDVGDEGVV
ncbi:hypothetical protein TRAPUB_10004 [Trametes pubescens]|uniref:Uncharacterized protein n=1 Tax=Trametes pubescens TaxID=154538 RepID=A0A1M2W0U9_TRAPU|nr:hypothetical protein TRAPUB_10004 [Trametes pubescens]